MAGDSLPVRGASDVFSAVEEDDLQLVEDPDVPTDAWGRFLAMRFHRREEFLRSLGQSEQDLIRRELDRVQHFRNLNNTTILDAQSGRTLIESLEAARLTWRQSAINESPRNIAKCRKQIATYGRASVELTRYEPNMRNLKRVQEWDPAVLPDSSPPGYIDPRNTGNTLPHNDNDANYGYNGWLIEFRNSENGTVGVSNESFNGDFPHQKMSIEKLLYNKAESPLKRSDDKSRLRYFHLPANNMEWVEVGLFMDLLRIIEEITRSRLRLHVTTARTS